MSLASDSRDGAVSESGEGTARKATRFAQNFEAILENCSRVIMGKPAAIRMALTCLFSEGHLLIEDVPGVGKTSLAKAIAQSIDGSWQRIQFTPDLLPSDVTGVQIWNQESNEFEFHPGGVFANVVIGDEINRASPKTQSALLEVMEEHQVTIDSTPYLVPRPFIVIATQNPVEHDGTYNLPEAQLDRFAMRMALGYPDIEAEMSIIGNDAGGTNIDDIGPVATAAEVRRMIALTDKIYISPKLQHYMVSISAATRSLPELRLGVSPRGTVALARTARAYAAANGRSFVTADDVKDLAPLVLAHRMILSPEAELQGHRAVDLLARVMASVPVPQERAEV
ncbi:MAG: MoxR family ATPase [Actinomycetota bacterium]|nr:MoxR family ATPase [Actinomycetota bacterium]